MFLNKPISLSRNQATKLATTPIPMAMSAIRIIRGVVVKSPNSSARVVCSWLVAFDDWLMRRSLKAGAYGRRSLSTNPQEQARRSAAPANAAHEVLAECVLRAASVPGRPHERPRHFAVWLSHRGQPVGSLIRPCCDGGGRVVTRES